MKFKIVCFLLFVANYSFSQIEVGHLIDINKCQINGYFDEDDYSPKKVIKIEHNIGGDKFSPGYYYDLNNVKIEGYLKYSQYNTNFKFKNLKNDQSEKTIEPTDCISYVIGKDSFIVIQDFDIYRDLGKFRIVEKSFVEVLDEVGNLTFYKHVNVGFNNTILVSYLYENKQLPREYKCFPKGFSKFKEPAINVFGKFEYLKNKIEIGGYDINDVPTLIKLFKYRLKSEEKTNVYFSQYWDEAEKADNPIYYAQVDILRDSIYDLKYYSVESNKLLFSGQFSSLYPHKKQGQFIGYYPSGIERKKINYVNDVIRDELINHFNGNKRYLYLSNNFDELKLKNVYDINGTNILDVNGNGKEIFYDSILNRELNNEYLKFKLVKSYYIDSLGNKVFMLSKRNAKIVGFGFLNDSINKILKYPKKSILSNNHGVLLLKCLIDSNGYVKSMKIIKGIDAEIDSLTLSKLTILKTNQYFRPGKQDKVKVRQELIIPIEFAINGFSRYSSNYNYNNMFMMQHQMMMQNSIPHHVPVFR